MGICTFVKVKHKATAFSVNCYMELAIIMLQCCAYGYMSSRDLYNVTDLGSLVETGCLVPTKESLCEKGYNNQ